MRVLLDECLPRGLKRELRMFDVSTVPEVGWAGKKNGELLRLASERFDVFVTIDKNIENQQNLIDLKLAIVLLDAHGSRLADLQTLVPILIEVLAGELAPGKMVRLRAG